MQYVVTCAFIALDYLTGWLQSIYNDEFQSSIMRQGIFHKLSILAVLIMAALFDWSLQYIDLGVLSAVPISSMVCAAFTVMEIGSVLENLHKINDEIPASFTGLLGLFKGDNHEDQ